MSVKVPSVAFNPVGTSGARQPIAGGVLSSLEPVAATDFTAYGKFTPIVAVRSSYCVVVDVPMVVPLRNIS